MCLCMHVRMHVCVYIYIYIFVCVCVCVCMHACAHVRIKIGGARGDSQLSRDPQIRHPPSYSHSQKRQQNSDWLVDFTAPKKT